MKLILWLAILLCLKPFEARTASGMLSNPTGLGMITPSLILDLKAYYKLDETSGVRYDSKGTYHTTDVGSQAAAAGLFGNGIVGANNVWQQTPDFILDTNKGGTYSFWMKPTSGETGHPLVRGDANETYEIKFEYYSGNSWFYFLTASRPAINVISPVLITTGTGYEIGRWIHIAYVLVPNPAGNLGINQVRAFTNGVLASVNGPGGADTCIIFNDRPGTYSFRIGCHVTSPAVSGYKGIVDEVAIWNRNLSDAEVAILCNSSKGRRYPFNSGP